MKYVVTGADGYIGRYVVSWLLAKGQDVVVATRRSEEFSSGGARRVRFNLRDADSSAFDVLGRPDILINLAWEDGFNHGSSSHFENASVHIKFLRHMLEGGLKHVVGVGSVHEVGYHVGPVDEFTPQRPQHPYGVAKNYVRQVQELLCKEFGAFSQWMRCYYIVGDDDLNKSIFTKLLSASREGKTTFPLNSGELLYDFIDVEELGALIASASSQTKVVGVINACSGEPVSLKSKVIDFVSKHGIEIELKWGEFPLRPYDSRAIWGETSKTKLALENALLVI